MFQYVDNDFTIALYGFMKQEIRNTSNRYGPCRSQRTGKSLVFSWPHYDVRNTDKHLLITDRYGTMI